MDFGIASVAAITVIAYLVGVAMGRYSLDIPGLAYAGGEWDASKYTTIIFST